MADAKISALTALTQADLAPADDLIAVVDTGATATKKITLKEAVGGSINQLAQTWNATATTFAGLSLSVTDTASAAGSNLLDLQVGGASQFKIDKAGVTTVGSGTVSPRINFGSTAAAITGDNSIGTSMRWSADRLTIDGIGITLFSNIRGGIYLAVDAPNTLAQRNGTNAQTFRLYGTYTAADNFQRLNAVVTKTASGALSGASVTLSAAIPDGAVVVGVTSRVSTLITGATGYQIGTVADPDRWGDITGTAVGTVSKNSDWTVGTVECFTSATDIVLTANGSNFTAGAIEVCVHYLLGDAD